MGHQDSGVDLSIPPWKAIQESTSCWKVFRQEARPIDSVGHFCSILLLISFYLHLRHQSKTEDSILVRHLTRSCPQKDLCCLVGEVPMVVMAELRKTRLEGTWYRQYCRLALASSLVVLRWSCASLSRQDQRAGAENENFAS